jgi:prevent-host-death family protein
MKTVGLFEAKAKLSEICAQVARRGEPVIITRRGTPWVRIEPLAEAGDASRVWEAAAEYRRSHRVTEDFEPPARTTDPDDEEIDL